MIVKTMNLIVVSCLEVSSLVLSFDIVL